MFLPGRNFQAEAAEKQRVNKQIEEWAGSLLNSDAMRSACTISIQEVQCGDPQCAPIDTIVTLVFQSGGQGMVGLPMEAKDVTLQELDNAFPPPDVLEKWFLGEEVEWPPMDEPSTDLRFDIGTEVVCRVGPTDWAPGRVIQLWYREASWPDGAFAPYKIKLDDGRDIFAPADLDQIIKLNPNPAPREEVLQSEAAATST